MREFGGNLAKLRKIMNKQKAYDKDTVDDIVRLARMVMGSGFFKDMSAYEVKRLLAAIKKGVGAEDLTPIANNVVDMLVQHQLRESKNMLHKLMQVRGRKVDDECVERRYESWRERTTYTYQRLREPTRQRGRGNQEECHE